MGVYTILIIVIITIAVLIIYIKARNKYISSDFKDKKIKYNEPFLRHKYQIFKDRNTNLINLGIVFIFGIIPIVLSDEKTWSIPFMLLAVFVILGGIYEDWKAERYNYWLEKKIFKSKKAIRRN